MNYNTLRTAIASAINTPANPRISGAILQQQLIGIVNALDMGALYLGMAGPNTTPNAEANGFYFATQAGTYTNFLNSGATAITVSNGEIALLVRSGKAWAKEHMMTMPYIDPTTKHWIVDGLDSGVVAEGQEGQNAYVYIMYAASLPTADADMHSTPQAGDKWIGVYSGNLKEAPTTYNSYVWSKYVGEDGNSIGSFKYKSYDADAAADLVDVGDTTTEDIGGLSASQNTLDVIVLMPNAASSPTKTMMIATQDDGNNGYEFVYIGDLQNAIPNDIFSYQAKVALISLLSKVAYIDDNGQNYIDTLQNLLIQGVTVESITATLVQDAVIVDTMKANDTKPYITVVANMSDGTVISVDNFGVVGNLSAAGQADLTISALDKTTTLTVNVLHNYSDLITNFNHQSAGTAYQTCIAYGDDYVKIKASSTQYEIWIADSKGKTRWPDVVGKTLKIRVKWMLEGDAPRTPISAFVVNTTSLGTAYRIWDPLTLTQANDGYMEGTFVVDVNNFSSGSLTPTNDSAFGMVFQGMDTSNWAYIYDVQIIDVTPSNQ